MWECAGCFLGETSWVSDPPHGNYYTTILPVGSFRLLLVSFGSLLPLSSGSHPLCFRKITIIAYKRASQNYLPWILIDLRCCVAMQTTVSESWFSVLSCLQILAPLPIGFAVFLVHLATIPITGTGINPARSLGAAIIYNKDLAWDDQVSILRSTLQ